MKRNKMLPCPFCGKNIDITDPDTLYPSGVGWKFDEILECKSYHHYSEIPKDNWCFQIYCECGCNLYADSKEEVIALWNKRV